MNRVATAPVEERRLIIQEAARDLGFLPMIVEKDFWVCWMLGLLFSEPLCRESLVFKGGTSLSKVFHVIERFSEDIDLSVAPAAIGISEADVELASSRRQRDEWMRKLEENCCRWVQCTLSPRLEQVMQESLGKPVARDHWLVYESDPGSQSPVLHFHYPSIYSTGADYIRRTVKLEFGSLTDQRPSGSHRVKPWLAAIYERKGYEMGCGVVAMEAERTFWEKATILHAEHHRAAESVLPPRYSRHYSDMAALAGSAAATVALQNGALRQQVVDWKTKFFARSWARYDLAVPGTFRLLPSDSRVVELERDYQEMRDMFLGTPRPFSEILATLSDLENTINQA